MESNSPETGTAQPSPLMGLKVIPTSFDRFQFPVALDDADFDPEKLWPAKK